MKTPDDLKDSRRRRLREVRDSRFAGNNTYLATAVERDPQYIGRAINGAKAIGERLARHIEEALDLPPRWLDGDDIEAEARARITINAHALHRCLMVVDRWAAIHRGKGLQGEKRVELACYLYEQFHDQPETGDARMIASLNVLAAFIATQQAIPTNV